MRDNLQFSTMNNLILGQFDTKSVKQKILYKGMKKSKRLYIVRLLFLCYLLGFNEQISIVDWNLYTVYQKNQSKFLWNNPKEYDSVFNLQEELAL